MRLGIDWGGTKMEIIALAETAKVTTAHAPHAKAIVFALRVVVLDDCNGFSPTKSSSSLLLLCKDSTSKVDEDAKSSFSSSTVP